MSTNTQRNVQRFIEVGTVLVLMGAGLNLFVIQTLGSFDVASVLLALYVAQWAFVLGLIVLLVLSVWLLWTAKPKLHEPTIMKPHICRA